MRRLIAFAFTMFCAAAISPAAVTAQPSFQIDLETWYAGTRVPIKPFFLDYHQDTAVPLFNKYYDKSEVLGQTFSATMTFKNGLVPHSTFKHFALSDLVGFDIQIGEQLWSIESGAELLAGFYWTDGYGNLTGLYFDYRNSKGNGLFLDTKWGRPLWMATHFFTDGYTEPYSTQACGVSSDYFFDGACFGGVGAKITALGVLPGEGEEPGNGGDPVTSVPEPAQFALLGVGLIGLFVTTRRRRCW